MEDHEYEVGTIRNPVCLSNHAKAYMLAQAKGRTIYAKIGGVISRFPDTLKYLRKQAHAGDPVAEQKMRNYERRGWAPYHSSAPIDARKFDATVSTDKTTKKERL